MKMENNNSFWLETNQRKKYAALQEDVSCDVCVIGGGITGISCAYYLTKQGIDTVVLERDRIASKTTGHTTAKITSQHDLFYDYLMMSKGKEFSKAYYEANEQAIDNIEEIIKEEKIACDFKRVNHYVYTDDMNKVKQIKDEATAVKAIGGKCEVVTDIGVPTIHIQAALQFLNQAQFNVIKYMSGLCDAIQENGGRIYEQSKVVEYNKEDATFIVAVETKEGTYTVTCKHLVVATRYPIFNVPGFHFIKMYQEMSYGVAVKLPESIQISDMYISEEQPMISLRTIENNGERYLLVIGNNHKTGEEIDTTERYHVLEEVAKQITGNDVGYRWNTEDCIGLDKIAYIGKYSNLTENMYVATGYKKWGMTTSNIAANIITDMITGKENEWLSIFDATRLEPVKNREEVGNMVKESVKSIVMPRLDIAREKKYCTHLGCELTWNDLTKTWDCPCHGSRFEKSGESVEAPSIKDIEEPKEH